MANGTWNRVVARALLVGFLCGVLGLAVTKAMAAPIAAGAPVDLNADQRALIEQLIADKAITLATARREAYEDRAKLSKDLDAKHRALRAAVARESGNAAELARVRKERDEIARQRQLADAGQEELSQKLQVRDRELQAAEARASGNAAELARVRKARDQIATQRQELVAALAERDQTLAAELRAYREVVTGIATSPDPRKRRALQRFADGEQREALADFDAIADANRARRVKAVDSADANPATRVKAIDIADAAERRPTAKLAHSGSRQRHGDAGGGRRAARAAHAAGSGDDAGLDPPRAVVRRTRPARRSQESGPVGQHEPCRWR
jgi:hypothetical protein